MPFMIGATLAMERLNFCDVDPTRNGTVRLICDRRYTEVIVDQRINRAAALSQSDTLHQVPASLRDVASQSLGFLEPRLARVFSQANERLFARAESADSMQDRSTLFEISKFLSAQREHLITAFAVEFLAGFMPSDGPARRRNRARTPSGKLGEVEVLNGDAFELSVAVSTVTSRSANRHKAYVDRLTPVLVTSKEAGPSNRRNPLSVFRITGAFMTALGTLQLDSGIQRLLLDEFEKEVIDSLDELYGDVCRSLHLDTWASDASAEPEEFAPDSAGDWSPSVGGGSQVGAEFDELRCLIHGSPPDVRGASESHRVTKSSGPALSSAQLLEVLSSAAIDGFEIEPGQPIDLGALLGNALAMSGKDISQVDELARDTLQLVSLLFEHILRDEDISIPLASIISRLQIPVLKVAIIDSSVFDNADHAVRKVINHLADVGIGWWGDTDQIRVDPLYRAIDGIVTRIVDECHDNVEVFAEADDELQTVIARSANRAQNLERRLTEREAGKAKVQAARRAVQELLNSRASGLRLPDGIGLFVRQIWSQVMVFLCVRHGVQSTQWQEADETLEELLQLGQPASQKSEVARRTERLPFLFERIEHWLHLAGSHAGQVEERVRALYTGFEDLGEHDRAWFESGGDYEVYELGEMEVIELVASDALMSEGLDEDLEALLRGLCPGIWMEFVRDGEPGIRCRLSMVFEQSRDHLFVDHRGVKVCELTAMEVAQSLRDGTIRKLNPDPVVERALDEMISELRASIRDGATARVSARPAGG